MRMRVAVLGGGLQGCSTALALAHRGVEVALFDRNAALLSRTAIANEGKVHLGYMYAADPTLATAKTMMAGALAFAPFFERHLGIAVGAHATSIPAAYVVHRDSQHDVDEASVYLADVHRLLAEAAEGRKGSYFGADVTAPPRRWSAGERDARFHAAEAVAVFDTPEVAINPVALAAAVRERIASQPLIEVRLNATVRSARIDGERVQVEWDERDGAGSESFDHAVNALWEGRLALDQTMGQRPGRPWIHRLKYGVSFTLPDGLERPPSATFISGPFGEVVSYPDRLTYLTWYPSCLRGFSSELVPPDWQTYPAEPLHGEIIRETFTAMSAIVPSLAAVDPETLPDVRVKGGVIVAWGKTDIYDPQSELHRRHEIGVISNGRYHSIDPGKLTMAPYFAEGCAARICGEG
jgi:glycine/D-amino acid oxidase-like deaminating enzyme